MPRSTTVRLPWHTLIGAALTLGLLWLFFRNVAFADIWRAILGAHLGLIGAAILSVGVTYLLRAWRWVMLLRPLGTAHFRNAFRTTVIGFTATFLLPARLGEILRPYLLARREGFLASSTFATVVVERLLDLTTVLLLFACSLPFLGIDVGRDVKVAGALAAAAAVGGMGLLFVFAGHPERLGRWAGRLARMLPAKAAAATERLVRTFAEGLAIMRRPTQLLGALAWSVLLWLSIAVGIWLTSRAFDLTFGFPGSFLVMMFLVVGVSLPTPGGAGGFHYTYRVAVTHFFGAPDDTAVAAALVLHAVSFVPVTIAGLAFMWHDGLTLGGLRSMRAAAEAAETP